MLLEGTVVNGQVVLDDAPSLPDGTRVEVSVKTAPKTTEPTLGFMLKYAGMADDLPADMAANHDHYLHGKPKT